MSEIYLTCKECGERLEFEENTNEPGLLELVIEPCHKCMVDELEEGYLTGKALGKAEGLEQGREAGKQEAIHQL